MNGDVQRDYQWGRRFLPEVKRILGEHLIGEAPYEEDAFRNTDLIVLRLEAVRIACRIRRPKYADNPRWRGQFTLRSRRSNGRETELAKVQSGWGRYLFYAFSDRAEQGLACWLLGDLNQFRLWFSRFLAQHGGALPGEERPNDDGCSYLRAFDIAALPTAFVVASRGLAHPLATLPPPPGTDAAAAPEDAPPQPAGLDLRTAYAQLPLFPRS